RGVTLATLCLANEVEESTLLPYRTGLAAVGPLLRLKRVRLAAPSIAVTRPLWMQRAHGHRTAPEPHAVSDQPLAETVEEIVCARAFQSGANSPTVHLDDALPDYAVKALRQAKVLP